MAWTDAARKASLEVRRRRKKQQPAQQTELQKAMAGKITGAQLAAYYLKQIQTLRGQAAGGVARGKAAKDAKKTKAEKKKKVAAAKKKAAAMKKKAAVPQQVRFQDLYSDLDPVNGDPKVMAEVKRRVQDLEATAAMARKSKRPEFFTSALDKGFNELHNYIVSNQRSWAIPYYAAEVADKVRRLQRRNVPRKKKVTRR